MYVIIVLSLFFGFVAFSVEGSNVLDPKYLASCFIRNPLDSKDPSEYPCHIAMFSFRNASYNGPIAFLNDELCEKSIGKYEHLKTAIAQSPIAVAAKRGVCSFSVKARIAEELGFLLLVIANNDKDGFPAGPTQVDFPQNIPVLMSGNDFWEDWKSSTLIVSAATNTNPKLNTNTSTNSDTNVNANVTTDTNVNTGVLGDATTAPSADVKISVATLPVLSIEFVATEEKPKQALMSPSTSAETRAAADGRSVQAVYAIFVLAAFLICMVFVLGFTTALHPVHLAYAQRHHEENGAKILNNNNSRSWLACCVQWIGLLAVLILFTGIRLGTLRLHSLQQESDVPSYNHRETDERVFETLVRNVLNNPRDYRLHSSTIQEIGLAPENYSDDLFIHPPLFVYLSAFLHGYVGVDLPIIPILLQLGTLALIPWICSNILPQNYVGEGINIALTALILFSSCPIAAFCSQKFWIDNCLMFSVTFCVAAHVALFPITLKNTTNPRKSHSTLSYVVRALGSGVTFGLVGLHCKITAAALLPFAGVWIATHHVITRSFTYTYSFTRLMVNMTDHRGKAEGGESSVLLPNKFPVSRVIADSIRDTLVYVLGACVVYAPWAYLYWKTTGRIMPNAWPSQTMLERSSFVRAAVNKPWYTYLYTLLTLSPTHLVGFVGAVVLAVLLLSAIMTVLLIKRSSRKSTSTASAADTAAVVIALENNTSAGNVVNNVKKKLPLQDEQQLYLYARAVLPVLAFAVWPMGFQMVLTGLGALGSGFQSRFLAPMLPGGAILSALVIHLASTTSGFNINNNTRTVAKTLTTLINLLALYSVLHVLYYGIMYAPLFADLDVSVVDVVVTALRNPAVPPESRESFQAMLRFMAHFGLVRQSR